MKQARIVLLTDALQVCLVNIKNMISFKAVAYYEVPVSISYVVYCCVNLDGV